MKYVVKFINIILTVFFIFTVIMLLLAFYDLRLENEMMMDVIRYAGMGYVILLLLTVLLLAVGVIFGAVYRIKKNGMKSFIKETLCWFLGGIAFTVILSLAVDKTFLNLNKLYLPVLVLLIPSWNGFCSIKSVKRGR